MSVTVEKHGPIFDGRAKTEAGRLAVELSEDVAAVGRDDVRSALSHVLRHQTGYYRSRVTAEAHGTTAEVTDGGIIYGPWLEGVSRRNQSTRFKGYGTFRKVAQQLDRKVQTIVRPAVDRYVRRIG